MPNTIACPKCHHTMPRGSQRFCGNCGASLTGPWRPVGRCSCGAPLRPGAAFCGACGARSAGEKVGQTVRAARDNVLESAAKGLRGASEAIKAARQTSEAERERSASAGQDLKEAAQEFGQSVRGAVTPVFQKSASLVRGEGRSAATGANARTAAYVFLGAMGLSMLLPWVQTPMIFGTSAQVSYLTAVSQVLIHGNEIVSELGSDVISGQLFLLLLFLAVPLFCVIVAIRAALTGRAGAIMLSAVVGLLFSILSYIGVSVQEVEGFNVGGWLAGMFGTGFWLFALTCLGGVIAAFVCMASAESDGST